MISHLTCIRSYETGRWKYTPPAKTGDSDAETESEPETEETQAIIGYDDLLDMEALAVAPRRGGISAECRKSPTLNDELDVRKSALKSSREKRQICSMLSKNVFFKHYADLDLEQIARLMFRKEYAADAVILKHREPCSHIMVVQHGVVDEYKVIDGEDEEIEEEEWTASYMENSGAVFGELGGLYGSPSRKVLRASSDVTVWALDRPTLRDALCFATERERERRKELLLKVWELIFRLCIICYMRLLELYPSIHLALQVPLFRCLDEVELMTAVDALLVEIHSPGEVVAQGFDPFGSTLFIISEVRCSFQDMCEERAKVSGWGRLRVRDASYYEVG
jgi:CRP-like cAMP-binding protein